MIAKRIFTIAATIATATLIGCAGDDADTELTDTEVITQPGTETVEVQVPTTDTVIVETTVETDVDVDTTVVDTDVSADEVF